MNAIGIIPARYAASRFPGKVLAPVLGRPLIQWTYEAAKRSASLEDVIVAADDERIAAAVRGFGGKVVLTCPQHKSGTDRIAEAVNNIDCRIVINIQADEPLIYPVMIDDLCNALGEDQSVLMATLAKKIDNPLDIDNPDVVKVVKDKKNFALYFSRAVIPRRREDQQYKSEPVFYKHLGLYAYAKDFLFTFTNLPCGQLEEIEKLEQLRALEHGYRIKVLETNFQTIGVDTPEDLEKLKQELLARGMKENES